MVEEIREEENLAGEEENEPEPPAEAQEALERLKGEIEEIKASEVKIVRLSGASVAGYAKDLEAALQQAWPELRRIFTSLPEDRLKLLRPTAEAFWVAQRRVEMADPSSKILRKRYAQAGELKEKVIRVLQAVGHKDEEVERVIAKVRPGIGYTDRANDLRDLHDLAKKYQEEATKKGLLTAKEIQQMPSLADDLLDSSPEKSAFASACSLRDRAWTLFFQIHQEAERHLRFLYAFEPEKLDALPSLYASRSAKRRK